MAVFLIDAQLPPMLARNLRAAGYEALHVVELGLQDAADLLIAENATDIGAVLTTPFRLARCSSKSDDRGTR